MRTDTGSENLYLQEVKRLVLNYLPMLTAAEDPDIVDDAVIQWARVFEAVNPDVSQKPPEERGHAFALFLRTLIPVTGLDMVKVSTELRRDYGGVGISFGLQDYAPRNKTGIEAGYERVLQTVMTMHTRFEAEHLPKERKHSLPSGGKSNEPASNTVIIPCDRLSVSMVDGKLRVKAHGGQYTKWGVPVYDEVLQASEIDPESIPVKGLDMAGVNMHVRMNGDKPVKVVKFDE